MHTQNEYRPVRRPTGNRIHNGTDKRINKKGSYVAWVSLILVMIAAVLVLVFAIKGAESNTETQKESDTASMRMKSQTEEPKNSFVPLMNPFKYTDDTAEFSDDFTFTNGIMIDLKNEKILVSKDAENKIYPASLTKIMTLIVAVESLNDLEATFEMTAEIIDPLILEGASMAGFAPGEKVTVKDMLYGLMLPSGADAASGLAIMVAGSEADFAELMNKKAKELGLKKTHFTNPSGLHDDEHYSTCHDIAMILRYAMNDELMRKILMTYQHTTASTEQHPEGILLTDTMFSRMYGNEPESAFILGGKTGYTNEAKNCLASFAVRCVEGESEDVTYSREPDMLLVTVGSVNKWGPVYDAISIYSTFADKNADIGKVINKSR